MKSSRVKALELRPGDLVLSPRTNQMMLILSILPREDKAHVTWVPLKEEKPVMSVEILGQIEFFKLGK